MKHATAAGGMFLVGLVISASAIAAEGDIPALPWQMAGNNHVLVGVVWNDAVLKLVPKGLTASGAPNGGKRPLSVINQPRVCPKSAAARGDVPAPWPLRRCEHGGG